MTARRLRVLISGAGIAGATLACLLSRQGHQVTVVERDLGVRSSGNPVDVRGPAYAVVEDLDLVSRLREVATSVSILVLVDAAGRRVASMATRRNDDRELEVPRADLSAALVEGSGDDVDFRFDDVITRLQADQHAVQATFDRSSPDRFDVVVGADGLHSGVRRLVFGPEADFVQHLGMYVATVRIDGALDRDDTVLMYNEPGAALALHPGRGTPGVAFLFRSPARVDPRDRAACRALLTQVYGAVGWRAPDLLGHYLAAEDTYFDAVSRVRVTAWSRGSITLLGDAASCVSLFGEGSSAAIAGAATLATELNRTADDVPAALARYESRHRALSRRGQRAVPVVSHLLIPASRPGIALRNGALRLVGRR